MNTNNHHIDELFAKELGNIEIEPPQSVWNGIVKKLDNKKRIGLLYFRIGMAAGLALLFSLSGVYWYNHSSQKDNVLVASKNNSVLQSPSQQQTQPTLAAENTIADNSNSIIKTQLPINAKINTTQVNEQQTISRKNIEATIEATENLNNSSPTINGDIAKQDIAQEYMEPKSGIIAMNKPVNEFVVDLNTDASSPEEIPTDAQLTNVETKIKTNRWSIEAQVAPLYSYRNITSSSELNTDFNNNESGMVSFSNAIKVNYQSSKRLTIQAGIAYSVIGQTLRNIYIQQPASNVGLKTSSMNANSRVNTSFGLINNGAASEPQNMDQTSSLQYTFFNTVGVEKMSAYGSPNAAVTTRSNADIIQRMQVIEIPIMARYYIVTGKFNWHLTGGLSTNILIGNDALLSNDNSKEKIGQTDNLKPMNYTGIVGTGLGYAIKKNIILTLEPTFKYYLNSISTTEIKVHPYSFGLYTGICYKL